MNTEPHAHKIRLEEDCPFPSPITFFYVVYGDQRVRWGSRTPWNNPYRMSAEERERRFTAAVKKAIAKHEAGTNKARLEQDTDRRLKELAFQLAPPDKSGFYDFLENQ